MLHVLVCRDDTKWAVFVREHETVPWSHVHREAAGRLLPALEASFPYTNGFRNLWSFSDRDAAEAMSEIAEAPEQIAGINPAVDLHILAPERRYPADNRWANVIKSHGRTDLWSPGGTFNGFRQGVVYEAVVKDQILNSHFGFDRTARRDEYWRTFLPPQEGVERVHYPRELWYRPNWNARELAPHSFSEFRDGPVVTPEMAAKRLARMPQNKSVLRRAKHAENAERFQAEAAERARQREGLA